LAWSKQASPKKLKRFEHIYPLYSKLEDDDLVTLQDVLPYAADVVTRQMTYKTLEEYNKTNLFPKEYYTTVMAAESKLGNWVEDHAELNTFPDEIEYIKRVTSYVDSEVHVVYYEVFRYRIAEPHHAAKHGWMLGVVGPYSEESLPYDDTQNVYSRIGFLSVPDEEARLVHESIFCNDISKPTDKN